MDEKESRRCRRCGTDLTNPASSKAGIGPVCVLKERAESGRVKKGGRCDN
jgi:hypothetical protein